MKSSNHYSRTIGRYDIEEWVSPTILVSFDIILFILIQAVTLSFTWTNSSTNY